MSDIHQHNVEGEEEVHHKSVDKHSSRVDEACYSQGFDIQHDFSRVSIALRFYSCGLRAEINPLR